MENPGSGIHKSITKIHERRVREKQKSIMVQKIVSFWPKHSINKNGEKRFMAGSCALGNLKDLPIHSTVSFRYKKKNKIASREQDKNYSVSSFF